MSKIAATNSTILNKLHTANSQDEYELMSILRRSLSLLAIPEAVTDNQSLELSGDFPALVFPVLTQFLH